MAGTRAPVPRLGGIVIEPFVADGWTEPFVRAFCTAVLAGRVVQGRGLDGRDYSVGPYRTATGSVTFALLSWPEGREELLADAFDVAAAFFAQLPRSEAERLATGLAHGTLDLDDEAV